MTPGRASGFTLVEVLLAMAVLMAGLTLAVRLTAFGQQAARVRPEAADQLQRLRVVAAMLQRDLAMAGSGPLYGADVRPLAAYLPPVVPARTGARSSDPELTFFDDRLSILFVPSGGVSTTLSASMPAATAELMVNGSGPGCPAAGLCGLGVGTRVLVAETSAPGLGFDLLTVKAVAAGLSYGSPDPPLSRLYDAATTTVMPLEQRVYWFDRVGRRLMLYDGGESDVPLVDEVVAVQFSYWIDPSPSAVRPPAGTAGSCAYAPGDPPAALVATHPGVSPVPVDGRLLTDGPVCGLSPHRFDADLLRIRRVGVRVRVQVSDPSLRGRGPRFAVPGTAQSSAAAVPDVELSFETTLRMTGAGG